MAKGHRKPNSIWNSQRSMVTVMSWCDVWLIYLAFMWQLCFLWRFRLRVSLLSLFYSPSCVMHYKPSRKQLHAISCFLASRSTDSWYNRDSVLWEAKAICGTTSLKATVLALFYESVKRGTKTKEIDTTTTTKWTKTTNKPVKNWSNVWNFIFMLDFSIFIEDHWRKFFMQSSLLNQPSNVEFVGLLYFAKPNETKWISR